MTCPYEQSKIEAITETEETIRDKLTYLWLEHMVEMFGWEKMVESLDEAKDKLYEKLSEEKLDIGPPDIPKPDKNLKE